MKLLFMIAVAAILCLSACVPETEILKRYQSADFDKPSNPVLTLSFFADDPDRPTKPLKIVALSDHAQAAVVQAAATKGSNLDEVKAFLSDPTSDPANVVDSSHVVFHKHIILNLQESGFHPADRLSQATITVRVPQEIYL